MPSFAQPLWLLTLPLVPALLVYWRRRGQAALFFPAARCEGIPEGRRSVWARRGALWLRGLGLSALIVALAGPRWPDPGSRIPTDATSLAFVLDVSASMSDRDFIWKNQLLSRLEAAKKVFRLFVAGGEGPDAEVFTARPNDLVSLVVFATRPDTACPLTLDHGALLKILDSQEPRTLATEAHSNPGDAIAWALAGLENAPTRRRAIVLLTDGEANVPPPALTPRQAAQLAGNLEVPIYAINAGNEFAEVAAKSVKPKESLKEIAQISGGRYFEAPDGKGLAVACAEIDRIERDRVPSFQFRRWREGFAWFVVLSIACWLSLHALESTRWRRIP